MARRADCRICGGRHLTRFLDLGKMPLANGLLTESDLGREEPRFDLDVSLCPDCSLVQVCEVVPPEVLFRSYLYVSGTSRTMREHFQGLAALVSERFLDPGSLVVEPACNDGTLLLELQKVGARTLGVEPATNIAELARNRGLDVVGEFFGRDVAASIRASRGLAAAVIATNVLAHVDDVNDFVAGVSELVARDGVFIMEAPYVLDMLDGLQFDNIYHEHLCSFSMTALDSLFRRHGLRIFDVTRQRVHGGSLRVFAQREGGSRPIEDSVARYLSDEARRDVREAAPYLAFANAVHEVARRLTEMVSELTSAGRRIAAYGASAKGSTLLNFTGIGRRHIDYVVDKSPMKQGLYTPGTHLPIVPTERILDDQPDHLLLLAWNFADEIRAQESEYVRRGGRFIIPLPAPRLSPAP